MPGLAGVLMMQGAPLCEDDLRAALRMRSAFPTAAGRACDLTRLDGALLLGRGPGPGAPGSIAASEQGGDRDRFAVVLSGRIDNAVALRAELGDRGGAGPMTDDASILREAVRAWGAEAAAHLAGGFAFAAYDRETGTLLCGRDRFGIEPFHYVALRDRLVFASDLASLAHWPGVRRSADAEVLTHYLAFGFCPVDRAPLRGVERLGAAYRLVAERTRPLRVERYWTLARPPARRSNGSAEPAPASARADAAAELRARLDRALGPLDGAVGVLLPGDAASLALAEAAVRASARDDGPIVHTFEIVSETASGRAARAPAGSGRTQRHRVRLDASSAQAALRLVPLQGEPFADPASLAGHALLAEAEDRVTRCLSAAGGSELFLDRARYGAFTAALARHRDQRIQPSVLQGFHATMPFVRDLYGDLVGLSSDVQRLAMAGPALIGSLLLSPVDDLGSSLERADEAGAADLCARIDLAHGAPRVLAPLAIARHRADVALGAPFLDPAFADWAAALPQATRLADAAGPAHTLGMLRGALSSPVPARAVATPALDEWLRTSLRERLEDTLASAAFRGRELFRMSWIDRLLRDHLDGTRANGALLWALLCLETWFLTLVDRIPEAVSPPAAVPMPDHEVAA